MHKNDAGRRDYHFAVVIACLVVLTLPCASAQDVNPRITILGGASLLSGSRAFVVGSRVFDTQFQNGVKFGIRGTVNLREHWGAEATYSFGTNNLQVTQVAPPVVQIFDVHLHQFTGNALYFFTARDRSLRPFATAGLGVSRFSPTGDAKLAAAGLFLNQPAVITASSQFNFNFGGGIEWRRWEDFGVRFDFRDHVTGIPRFGLPENATSPGAPFFPIHGRVQDVEVSAGFVYYFVAK
jgi:hypothetical protein